MIKSNSVVRLLTVIASLLSTVCFCWADSPAGKEPAGLEPILINYGVNEVDLDGTGKNALIIKARRENGNAHGAGITTIYIWEKVESGERELQIAPIQSSGKEELELRTWGGADCLLTDFRIFRNSSNRTALLVTAERSFGDSFIDSQKVTFSYYRLVRDPDAAPRVYFKHYKQYKSQKSYCDVGEALKAEAKFGLEKE